MAFSQENIKGTFGGIIFVAIFALIATYLAHWHLLRLWVYLLL